MIHVKQFQSCFTIFGQIIKTVAQMLFHTTIKIMRLGLQVMEDNLLINCEEYQLFQTNQYEKMYNF